MPMPGASGGVGSASYAGLTFLMWFVMMIGMMLPSVGPTVLLFQRVARRAPGEEALARTATFLCGYLLVWFGFSAAATFLQLALIGAGWLDAMGVLTAPWTRSALLVAVGVYQWLPIKGACLEHCRSPAQFLVAAYRPGRIGALRMGLHHGLYCLGCCWALMLLLLIGGVMNLLWVAAISGLVFVEKLVAGGDRVRRGLGVAALLGAVALLLR